VAVPPFIILAAIPVALQVPDRRLRRALVAGLAVVGVPLTVLSGSRSAWIAMTVAAIVLATPALRRLPAPWRWGVRGYAVAAALLVVLAGTLAVVGRRLLEVSSLVYRGDLWRDTITAWRVDPLLGLGPGAMPYAREAAAPPLSIPIAQPHSHDVLLGVLGDTGLVGLLAALLLVVAFVRVAGPWRVRSLVGRLAFAILTGFSVGMLFEDLTFLPNFNLLVVLLVAICLSEAGAVSWRPHRPHRGSWIAAGAGALALAAIMLIGDAAAISYRGGVDAAAAGDWATAQGRLALAVRLNSWHPMGPKTLALAADRNADADLALASAAQAVKLNPGDGDSWTNLAILCLDAGDFACARHAADRSVAASAAPINAAVVYDRLGDSASADKAYRLSLLTNLWTGLTRPWPRQVPIGEERVGTLAGEQAELNLLIARRLEGEDLAADTYQSSLVRALALAMTGDRLAAQAALTEAIAGEPASPLTWQISALLQHHWGEDDVQALRMIDVTSGVRPVPATAAGGVGLTRDIASFRAYPGDGLVLGAERLTPTTRWPWVLDPLLAP
jgi:tetratricopeptide (TPR) repeat protein